MCWSSSRLRVGPELSESLATPIHQGFWALGPKVQSHCLLGGGLAPAAFSPGAEKSHGLAVRWR